MKSKRAICILIVVLLVLAVSLPVLAEDDTPDPTAPPYSPWPPTWPPEVTPPPPQWPLPTWPPEVTPPPPTWPPQVTAPPQQTPEPRPFPAWMNKLAVFPDWLYKVDVFPDWFYDLKEQPVWFYELTRVPSWFYTITEIPDWFYPSKESPTPEPWPEIEEGDDEFPWPDGEEPPDDEEEEEPPDDIQSMYDESIYPFVYQIPDSSYYFASNVPSGMITDIPVIIDYPLYLFSLTQNQEDFPHSPGEVITQDGAYEVFYGSDVIFNFRIISNPTNDLEVYIAPYGYYIQRMKYEDEAERNIGAGSFELAQDGAYSFTLANSETDAVFRIVGVTLDTVPPTLTFTGWVEGETTATEIVEYFLDEPDDPEDGGVIITVTLDGKDYVYRTPNTLDSDGRYIVTATDLAGNQSIYSFRVRLGMNVSAIWVIVIIVLLLAGLAVFLLRNRQKARVR